MILRALCLAILAVLPVSAWADSVIVTIDLSDQDMTVQVGDEILYDWPVSTARAGKCTPVGFFRVQAMKRVHYSTLYNGAPMPHSIFFSGNYAIHGTTQTDRLGRPASAGCVRLHPENAKTLFELVLEHGRAATRIKIQR